MCKKRGQEVQVSHQRIYDYAVRDRLNSGCLYLHLRHRHKPRRKRKGKPEYYGLIKSRIGIEERPAIVEEKARLGDWEKVDGSVDYCRNKNAVAEETDLFPPVAGPDNTQSGYENVKCHPLRKETRRPQSIVVNKWEQQEEARHPVGYPLGPFICNSIQIEYSS